MAQLGKWLRVWCAGYDLTTDLIGVTPDTTYDELESGGFTEDKWYQAGRGDGTIQLEGFLIPATTETAFKAIATNVEKIVSAAFGNNALPTIGSPVVSLAAQQVNYLATPDLNGLIKVSATFKALNSITEWGKLLADATITANGSQASLDNGASSSDGGVGWLHIAALSAGDTITVVIQDSPDDAAWADLITFTLDGTAITSERLTVAGTVDRYTKAEYTVIGSGVSFPIMVSFKRN